MLKFIRIFLLSLVSSYLCFCIALASEPAKPTVKTVIQEADAAYKKKDYQKVLELLRGRFEDLDRDGLLLLSRAYNRLEDFNNEAKTLSLIIASNPDDHVAITQLGYYKLKSKDPKVIGQAAKDFRNAIRINKKFLPAYQGLLDVLNHPTYESKQVKKTNRYEARLVYHDMIEAFGDKVEYHSQLCKSYSADAINDTAIAHCKQAIQLAPSEADNHVYMAQTLYNQSERQQAMKILKKVTEDFPKSELAQWAMGDILYQEKDYRGALKYFEAAVGADDKSWRALIGHANSAFELEKYEQALPSYKQACDINSRDVRDFRRATTYLRINKKFAEEQKYSSTLNLCSANKQTPYVVD